jgi:fructose-specific component phosphotransferase system IIB-like protein
MRENKVFAATELVKKLNEAENLIKAGSRKQNSNQLQNKNVGDI